MISHYDFAGLVGMSLGLYSYARLQWQRDYAKRLQYSLLNSINAALMLYSLSNNWNLAAFTSMSIFGLLSLYGVYRCLKYRWLESRSQKAISIPADKLF
ncbi:MAG: hypothetical protein WC612_01450 [Bdellovibrionales bacterium]|jgi:hypothetical protein